MGLNEWVVYGNDVDVVVLDAIGYGLVQWHRSSFRCRKDSRIAEDNTANATETIDTDL